MQYVPFLCKSFNYGVDVNLIGIKQHLYVCTYPAQNLYEVASLMSLVYTIPAVPIPNFMNLTLCPGNQIIHPGRVYGMFKDWDGKTGYNPADVPLLYEGLDDASAHEIQILSDDIQNIKAGILKQYPDLDLTQVLPIKERIISMYGAQVKDTSNLTRVFQSNQGYSRVTFPMVPSQEEQGKVVLNLNARFFWEDVPYGLLILKDIGELAGVPTPAVDKQILFHQKFMPVKYLDEKTLQILDNQAVKDSGAPRAYGITSLTELVAMSISNTKIQLFKPSL